MMKLVGLSLLALAILTTAVAARVHLQPTTTEESCAGLGCWPDTPSVKHRPAHRATLEPVW
jgi:hypothetical protein